MNDKTMENNILVSVLLKLIEEIKPTKNKSKNKDRKIK